MLHILEGTQQSLHGPACFGMEVRLNYQSDVSIHMHTYENIHIQKEC